MRAAFISLELILLLTKSLGSPGNTGLIESLKPTLTQVSGVGGGLVTIMFKPYAPAVEYIFVN